MTILLTGATGYVGSYLVAELRQKSDQRLALLVRADDPGHAQRRLWKALQLHIGFGDFTELIRRRVDVVLGDLTTPGLGLSPPAWQRLARSITSIIHCAASLNRKSAKACFNTNLRGTLEVIKLARAAHDDHGLDRLSEVSTVAVAGTRQDEIVREDDAIDWSRSDYDPYARTKKFCEHMLHELLPDVPRLIFRPSIVLGDSRFSETTQFDMVRAFVFLAGLRALPLDPSWRIDIVPADFVGRAIAALHLAPHPAHSIYHLSSGADSLTYGGLEDCLAEVRGGKRPIFVPRASRLFGAATSLLGSIRRRHPILLGASLLRVFWPYLVYNTVFDNQRITAELGETPAPFTAYAADLYRFATRGRFTYPYQPWPAGAPVLTAQTDLQVAGATA